MNEDDAALIERHIEWDPHHPGPSDVRLSESWVPVWAVIGHLPSVGGDAEQAAADYELTAEAMAAALAYYEANRGAIDARLAANAGEPRIPVTTGS